jgi:hypothetical protein
MSGEGENFLAAPSSLVLAIGTEAQPTSERQRSAVAASDRISVIRLVWVVTHDIKMPSIGTLDAHHAGKEKPALLCGLT